MPISSWYFLIWAPLIVLFPKSPSSGFRVSISWPHFNFASSTVLQYIFPIYIDSPSFHSSRTYVAPIDICKPRQQDLSHKRSSIYLLPKWVYKSKKPPFSYSFLHSMAFTHPCPNSFVLPGPGQAQASLENLLLPLCLLASFLSWVLYGTGCLYCSTKCLIRYQFLF